MKIIQLKKPIIGGEDKKYMFIEFKGIVFQGDGVAVLDYPDDYRPGGADEIVLDKDTEIEMVEENVSSKGGKSKRKSTRSRKSRRNRKMNRRKK